MSPTERDRAEPTDPLLEALGALPPHALLEPGEAQRRREARAAYLQSFRPSAWHGAALGFVARSAMPVFLATIVALYMTWAITAATALAH
jgi:hypothetical protein